MAPRDRRPHAVVIGSGFGGLASAVRLGARGYRVTVLEKLDAPGGRAYVFRQDGFTFDGGPTIVTAPFLLEELWMLCGRRLSDDVELRPITPFYRIRFADGSIFDYTGDAAAMREEVARFCPQDVAGYEAFMRASQEIYRTGFEELGDVPFEHFTDMLAVAPDLLRLGSLRSVHGLVSRYIKDARLRVVFSFHPLLVGGNPFAASSIYSLICFLERRWGVHFAMGGTGQLVTGLVGLIEGQGGKLRCKAEVAEITVQDNRATGVRLADGETLPADIVVSNACSAYTYTTLLGHHKRRRWTDRRIARARYSMSLFVWYFGTSRTYPDVAHHTILLGPRYRELLHDIFSRHHLAEDFSLYLHRPTATDTSLAPPGCDAFYVLSPVPHLDGDADWREAAEPYRRNIEKMLSETILPGLESAIVSSRMMTPQDFSDRLLSYKGAAFGLEPILTQSAWFRPHNKSEEVERLYLTGAGTHPVRVCPAFSPRREFSIGWCRMPMYFPDPPAFFPECIDRPVPTREDLAACRAMLRCGSRSFFAASLLLPRHVHEPATALYAFCRQADDAIDCPGGAGENTTSSDRVAALAKLANRLDRAYAADPLPYPADRAFSAVVASAAMPRMLPEALLEGFAWDAEGRRYETPASLYDYAARVAGSVGAMMAVLMGVRSEAALARACDLGMAMQLTNIARDVGEDARAGRLYLPLSWLREAGIDPDGFLADPVFSDALGGVIRRLIGCSERLYARGLPGVADLPLACRPGIRAAGLLYAGIGQELARLGYDSVSARARVPAVRKAGLLVSSVAAALAPRAAPIAPLPAARRLVDASALPPSQRPPRKPIGERLVWLLDLFERLDDSSPHRREALGN